MGILDRFVKQEVLQKAPEQIREEEMYEQFREQRMRQEQNQQQGQQQGQQYPNTNMNPMATPQPANIAKETMELYLKPKYPMNTENLTGNDRFWVLTDNEASIEIPTANSDREAYNRYKIDVTQMLDLDGCDNVDGLIQMHNLKIHSDVLFSKSRSDVGDGLRERVIPSVGVGLTGAWDQSHSKRPEEQQKRLFGLGGGK